MIDLHSHTLFSDGQLLPSELVYRAKVKGYTAIGLTDHGDFSTFDFVIPRIKKISAELSRQYDIVVVPGIEITYVPPSLISKAVKTSRRLGAKLIVVHGETPAETVPKGTNRAGILSGADILAHPGHITDEEVKLALKKNVCLEITSRKGHNKTNSYVAALAKKYKTRLVFDSDTHLPEDLLTLKKIKQILIASGLTLEDLAVMQKNAWEIIKS